MQDASLPSRPDHHDSHEDQVERDATPQKIPGPGAKALLALSIALSGGGKDAGAQEHKPGDNPPPPPAPEQQEVPWWQGAVGEFAVRISTRVKDQLAKAVDILPDEEAVPSVSPPDPEVAGEGFDKEKVLADLLSQLDERSRPRAEANFSQALDRVLEANSLQNPRDFRAVGNAQVEFTADGEEGNEVRCIAIAQDVAQVLQGPTSEQMDQWDELAQQIQTLKRELLGWLEAENIHPASFSSMPIFRNILKLRALQQGDDTAWELLASLLSSAKIDTQRKSQGAELEALIKESRSLRAEGAQRRKLVNQEGQAIRAQGSDSSGDAFVWRYKVPETPSPNGSWKGLVYQDGVLIKEKIVHEADRSLERSFRPDGKLLTLREKEGSTSSLEHYDSAGNRIYRAEAEGRGPSKYTFFSLDGEAFGTLEDAVGQEGPFRGREMKAAAQAYLEKLPGRLRGRDEIDTILRIELFRQASTRYVHDEARFIGNGDKSQKPVETVMRVKDGKMLGDCDDIAPLMALLTRENGFSSGSVYLPPETNTGWQENRWAQKAHLTCMGAFEKDGRYHAFSVGTYGTDINGIRCVKPDASLGQGLASPEAYVEWEALVRESPGYPTLREATDSVMSKFTRSETGDSGYRLPSGIVRGLAQNL